MRRLATLLLLLATLAPGQAVAAPAEPTKPAENAPTPAPAKEAPKSRLKDLNHRFQVGLSLRAGTGYRVIAPYGDAFCGDTTDAGAFKNVCGGPHQAWLELSPSFGITSQLEILVDVRFAVEKDFTGTTDLYIAPGIKYYSDADSWLKFYATGQVIFDLQDMGAVPVSSFDVGLRSALGLHFDILRYVGLFVQGGVNLGFKRWLTFVVDLGGGLQVRL